MFDHLAPEIFWPLFALFWLVVALAATYVFGRFVDSTNPFTNTRRNTHGRQQMASDWRKPQYLPEDWQ